RKYRPRFSAASSPMSESGGLTASTTSSHRKTSITLITFKRYANSGPTMKGQRMRHAAWISVVGAAALSTLLSCSTAPQAKAPPVPRAPMEDIKYANEWPAPNGDLYNTRVGHTTISSANVSKLGAAWTFPLTGAGANGRDFANPVV